MNPRQLQSILDGLEELGLLVTAERPHDEEPQPRRLLAEWRLAASDARAAYANWRRRRDRDSYAVYRAYADRADAAQDALAIGACNG